MRRLAVAALVISIALGGMGAAAAGPTTTTPTAVRGHTADGGLSQRTRWVLAIAIFDVAALAWWRGWLNPGAAKRRLTLADSPADRDASAAPRREGRPPSLR